MIPEIRGEGDTLELENENQQMDGVARAKKNKLRPDRREKAHFAGETGNRPQLRQALRPRVTPSIRRLTQPRNPTCFML